MFARVQRLGDPFGVQGVRQRHIDGVDIRIVDQRFIRAMRAWHARLVRELFALLQIAARDSDDIDKLRRADARDKRARYFRGAKYAETQSFYLFHGFTVTNVVYEATDSLCEACAGFGSASKPNSRRGVSH